MLFHRRFLGHVLRERIPDRPRRRLFVASLSFFLTFAGVRGVVFCITHQIPPFHFIQVGERHIHRLVIAIVILLLVGYGRLAEVGTGADDSSIFLSRLMSILYGVGAALMLDEFALWLNLRDVYWSREGRASIDAIILFGALLAVSTWALRCFNRVGRKVRGGLGDAPRLSPTSRSIKTTDRIAKISRLNNLRSLDLWY